jgi:transaldolase
MSSERLHLLHDAGQSLWLDFITRGILHDGELERRIREDALTGMTSNPTIFEKALAEGTAYDAQLAEAIRHAPDGAAHEAWQLFELVETTDVRDACDRFMPVFERTEGGDGYVSIEVSPGVAHKAEDTVAEARRLWETVGRPNVMVKVPGTDEGAKAVRQLIAEGINVNITLLFSIDAHRRVIEAYLAGLEERAARGAPIDRVASVASFFVSRVDSEIDKRLDQIAAEAAARMESAAPRPRRLAEGARGDREREARLSALPRAVLRTPVGGARREGREPAASSLGEHEHEEPRVPRRALRRATHRPRHGEHAAAGDPRCLPRPWRGRPDRGSGCRARRADDRRPGGARHLDAGGDPQAPRRRARQFPEVVRHAHRRLEQKRDELAGEMAAR